MNERKNNPTPELDEAGLRRLLEAAGPRPEIPPGELATIKGSFRRDWRELVDRRAGARRRFGWKTAVPMALAATLAVALAVGFWWRGLQPPVDAAVVATVEVAEGEARAEGGRVEVGRELVGGARLQTLESDAAPRLSVRLTGGQSVRLDAGTRLRLVSATLLELERGAVYVDSPPGTGSLEVRTGLGNVRDIGTQFEVRVNGGLRVRVREGSVEVERGEAHLSAVAGEELTVGSDGSIDRRAIAGWAEAWDWVVAAAPPFEGGSFEAYLDWLSRETGWRVRFADDELARSVSGMPLKGKITHLAADESVHVVLPAYGFEYRLAEGVLTVEP